MKRLIIHDNVFLKFNTLDFSADNPLEFDTYYIERAGDENVHCAGLMCGDYYDYAVGFDTNKNERVKGGIPYTITAKSGEIDVILK